VIHDISTNPLLKALSWMMAGSILIIAVLSAITTQNVLAIIMLIVILLSSVALSAGGLTTAIDLADRTIRRTWKVGAFAWHRVYSLDDFATVSIQDKSRLIEGYQLPFFSVQLVGRRKHISIYSTDDPEDAKSVYGAIAGYLRKAGISTQHQQSG
jgi:hypothetical protein